MNCWLCCHSDLAATVCIYCLFVNTFDQQLPSFITCEQPACVSVCASVEHAYAIIAVGVTNRRDQQKARFRAFVVPFGQP